MKLLAFAASNSRNSINAKLARHAADLVAADATDHVEIEILDLNDFEMPIYSVDREAEGGIPQLARDFFDRIGEADAVIVSFAEHNGAYTVAFKNVLDWASRVDSKIWQGTPLVMLAAVPGPGGGRNVLAAATGAAPFWGGDLVGSTFIPGFHAAFDAEAGELTDLDARAALAEALAPLVAIASDLENADGIAA